MNKPNVMRAIARMSLVCAMFAPCSHSMSGERDDALFEPSWQHTFPPLRGFAQVASSTRAGEFHPPNPTFALCMPDLYCSLAPDFDARDDVRPRLARATHAVLRH